MFRSHNDEYHSFQSLKIGSKSIIIILTRITTARRVKSRNERYRITFRLENQDTICVAGQRIHDLKTSRSALI